MSMMNFIRGDHAPVSAPARQEPEPLLIRSDDHHPEAAAFLSKHAEIKEEKKALQFRVDQLEVETEIQRRRIADLEDERARLTVALKVFQAGYFKMQAELTILAQTGISMCANWTDLATRSIEAAQDAQRRAGIDAEVEQHHQKTRGADLDQKHLAAIEDQLGGKTPGSEGGDGA